MHFYRVAVAAVAFVAASTLVGHGLSVPARAEMVPARAEPSAATDTVQRYIVQFDEGTSATEVVHDLVVGGGEVEESIDNVFPGAVVDLSVQEAGALRANPNVTGVELDTTISVADTQDSPPVGLDRVGQRSLPLDAKYDFMATGAGVTGYVVDSGVRADHVDFDERLGTGFTAVADGRGSEDCNGHGTHVAGILAGRTYGVAKSVELVPVRVLDCDGEGTLSGLLSGLDWIAQDYEPGTPAVANLSLGGAPSAALDAAVQALLDKGISVTVAAGNGDIDACGLSPARVPGVLTVGAVTESDVRGSFSNRGPCLDVFAPGVGIRSAWFTSADDARTVTGTSMAAPHVAGAAAALLQADPDLSPAAVAQRLVATSTTGVVVSPGTGSPNRLLWVDPGLVVTNPTVPSAPVDVSAVAGVGRASVAWAAAIANGSPVTAYTVTASPGGRTCATTGATACVVSDLANGTAHTFTVTATNGTGTGSRSRPSNRVTPFVSDAMAPTVRISAGPERSTRESEATFAFVASDPGRPDATLTYRCRLDLLAYTSCTSPITYSDLADGGHTFRVRALDESGNSSIAATRSWRVDTVAPTVARSAAPVTSTAARIGMTFAGADVGTGVLTFDARYRTASWNGLFGDFVHPDGPTRDWTGISAKSVSLPTEAGLTYCLSVRSRDGAGNTSEWSSEACTAIALDDRALAADGAWQRITSSYYRGTATTTTKSGAVLTRTGVMGRHVVLLATTCATCGSVSVHWDGELLREVSLVSGATRHQQLIGVADLGSTRTGTLTIRTLRDARTTIDGIAVRHN